MGVPVACAPYDEGGGTGTRIHTGFVVRFEVESARDYLDVALRTQEWATG